MKSTSSFKQQTPTRSISEIFHRRPQDLKPWPSNPRHHPEKQLAILMASIQTNGFTTVVLVDESGVILSGHGRVEAAKRLGLPTVPVRVISGLSEAQKSAYLIADNKSALMSEWDDVLLKAEMEILIKEDISIETTAFSTAEVDLMFDDPPKV